MRFRAARAARSWCGWRPDGRMRLEVRDNGKGLPTDYRIGASSSLGMRLVRSLADQIEVDLSVETSGGACFRLDFHAPLPTP